VKPLDRGFEDAVVVQNAGFLPRPLAFGFGQFHCERLAKAVGYKVLTSPIPYLASAPSDGARAAEVNSITPSEGDVGHGCSRVR